MGGALALKTVPGRRNFQCGRRVWSGEDGETGWIMVEFELISWVEGVLWISGFLSANMHGEGRNLMFYLLGGETSSDHHHRTQLWQQTFAAKFYLSGAAFTPQTRSIWCLLCAPNSPKSAQLSMGALGALALEPPQTSLLLRCWMECSHTLFLLFFPKHCVHTEGFLR